MFTLEDVLPPSRSGRAAGEKASHHHNHQDTEKREGKGEGEGERDEISLSLSPEDTRWLLVDHNEMTGRLATSGFAARVVGCVDHHADEGVVPRDADPRVVERSGSCASLVLERCAEIWEALGASSSSAGIKGGSGGGKEGKGGGGGGNDEEVENSARIDAQLARVALAPILIDTSNLGDESKTTAHDEGAVALAEAKIAAYEKLKAAGNGSVGKMEVEGKGEGVGERYDRAALFARLSALKDDLDDMSLRDIFRKDYKEWGVGGLNLATSSIPRGFGYLLARKAGGDAAEMASAVRRWGDEKDGSVAGGEKMDLVVLLTTFVDDAGEFSRELLVCARSEKGVRAAEMLEERWRGELGLESWGGGVLDSGRDGEGGEWCRCWTQRAVKHSRKQIAPMLRDALKEVAGQG